MSSKQPLSIVVITFNNYEELIRTLSSVPPKYQSAVFIVNGGSCDKTKALVAGGKYIGITEKDKGISDAFNKGVRLSNGEWIHFLNSGDTLLSDEIYTVSSEVANNIHFIYSNILFDDAEIGKIVIKPSFRKGYNLAKGIPFPHPGLVVRREVFDSIGGFDLSYKIGMDFNFICKMLQGNFEGQYVPVESVLMDGNGVSSYNEIEALKETYKSIQNLGILDFKARFFLQFSFFKAYLKMYSKVSMTRKIVKYIRKRRFS